MLRCGKFGGKEGARLLVCEVGHQMGRSRVRFGSGRVCFGCGVKEEEVEVPGVGRNVDADGGHRTPTHVVVFVNGIIGSSSNWKFAAREIVKRFPDDVVAHCSECNCYLMTLDGVDIMGERLAQEVISVIEQRPELRKISFIAHSLGGLVARFAIGRLYGMKPASQPCNGKACCERGDHEAENCENTEGKIVGLEAMNFIAFATPHAGSGGHRQIPMLCGSHLLERTAHRSSCIIKRTGRHLFLKDAENAQQPLLIQMVNDNGDLKFMSALQCFRRRVAYSNVCYDHIVGWNTASIRPRRDLPKLELRPIDEKYPHVVNVEAAKSVSWHFDGPLDEEFRKDDIEGVIIRGLNKVSWERVDVSFHKSRQRYLAHSTIQVKTYCINSDGSDVIFHMIDNFLL